MESPSRATLALTRACNNACLFCAQDGLAPLAESAATVALERLAGTAKELTFVGGEPTLHPELPALVRRARALGFTHVGLQTNGRRLRDVAFTAALAEAGLTDVHVSLHGADAAVHDYHSGVDGSFAESLAGVAAARARGLTVVATTVLTRSNYRVLSALPALLASRGAAAWQVSTVLTAGRAAAGFDRLAPRLALALPYALHAVAAARRLGLEAVVSGAPWCLLGPFAGPSVDAPRLAYAAACEACPARGRCPGVDATYLARFGADELAALSSAPAEATPSALARCFTGPGALAWPVDLRVPEPPAAVRARLGDLKKSTPAAAEVAGPPRKSGEALKELFPTLFDKPGG